MTMLIAAISTITRIVGYGAATVIFLLIFAMTYEVMSRYLFGAPTVWAFELGYMGMGAHFLLGAAFTLAVQGHVRVDLIYSRLSPRNRAKIDFVQYMLLMLPVCLWLTWELWAYALESLQRGERTGMSAWNPPIWPYRMLFFFGFALLSLQLFEQGLRAFQGMLAKRNPSNVSND